jgi:hypothetical protein
MDPFCPASGPRAIGPPFKNGLTIPRPLQIINP